MPKRAILGLASARLPQDSFERFLREKMVALALGFEVWRRNRGPYRPLELLQLVLNLE